MLNSFLSSGFYSHLFNDNDDIQHDDFNHHHHHHHHHHNLDLLDFIKSKTKTKNTNFIGHFLGRGAEIFDPDQHYRTGPYQDHYSEIDYNHFTSPYALKHHGHHYGHHYGHLYGHHYGHHYGDQVLEDHYHYGPGYYTSHHAELSRELHRLNNYASILKQRINYYTAHSMSPPLSLLNEFNHVNQLITTKSLYLPEHPHYAYEHHDEVEYPHDHGYLHYGGNRYYHDHFTTGPLPECKKF